MHQSINRITYTMTFVTPVVEPLHHERKLILELNLALKLNSVASFGLHLRYQPFLNYILMVIVTILYNETKKWAAILDIF